MNRAIGEALKSDADFRVGCVLYDKRFRVVGKGYSKRKTHPLQKQLSASHGNPNKEYLHAEVSAILSLRRGAKPRYAMLARIGAKGRLLPIDPCPSCLELLQDNGITIITAR